MRPFRLPDQRCGQNRAGGELFQIGSAGTKFGQTTHFLQNRDRTGAYRLNAKVQPSDEWMDGLL